jgi:hypothetical protein
MGGQWNDQSLPFFIMSGSSHLLWPAKNGSVTPKLLNGGDSLIIMTYDMVQRPSNSKMRVTKTTPMVLEPPPD